jgi:vacuole morphology and inheritance protein 14
VSLEKFLNEIKKIARVKRGLAESKRSQIGEGIKQTNSTSRSDVSRRSSRSVGSDALSTEEKKRSSLEVGENGEDDDAVSSVVADDDDASADFEEDWIPGQDVFVDHSRILDILVTFLGGSSG